MEIRRQDGDVGEFPESPDGASARDDEEVDEGLFVEPSGSQAILSCAHAR
jgi:hypothetical protein